MSKRKVKVSIIIPVYNSEEYLERCLQSVMTQTMTEIEIIIINDGSNDKSQQISNKCAKIDNRIKVINKKNEGVSAARNDGIKYSQGEYLLFVDSDDSIEKSLCEDCYSVAIKNNADTVKFSYFKECEKIDLPFDNCLVKSEKILRSITSERLNNEDCIEHINYSVWSYMFKADIIKKSNILFPNDINNGEDLVFLVKYLVKINDIYFMNKALYHYTRNPFSITNRYMVNYFDNIIIVKNQIREIVKGAIEFNEDEINWGYVKTAAKSIQNEYVDENKRFSSKYKYTIKMCNLMEVRDFFNGRKIPESGNFFNLMYKFMKYRMYFFIMLLNYLIKLKKLRKI